MSREEFIKEQIKCKGYTIKDYAKAIDMPYTTLLSMLNGSIGGAAIDSVIKICKGLGLTIEELQSSVMSNAHKPQSANTTSNSDATQSNTVLMMHPLLAIYNKLNKDGQDEVMNHARYIASQDRYVIVPDNQEELII